MNINDVINTVLVYKNGTNELPKHSFDLNDETIDMCLAALNFYNNLTELMLKNGLYLIEDPNQPGNYVWRYATAVDGTEATPEERN